MTLKTFIPIMMVLAAFGLTMVGCSGGDSGGPVSPQSVGDIGSYFPLGDGYLWTYTSYSPSGTPQGTFDMEIVGTHTFLSGIIVYFVEMPPGSYIGWAADEDGLYYYYGLDLDEANLYLIVANPVTLGATITIDNDASFTISSLNALVTTYMGTLSCVQLTAETLGTTIVEIFYLAENIGIVRYEYWQDAQLGGYDELTAYDFGE